MPDVCVYRLRNWVYLCNVGLLLTDEDGMMSDTKFTNGKLIISNPTEKGRQFILKTFALLMCGEYKMEFAITLTLNALLNAGATTSGWLRL